MSDDDGYEEVWAKVRRPKGQNLADSRHSAGWKRGFTAKNSESGPKHVEIRFENPPEDDFSLQNPAGTSDYPARDQAAKDEELTEAIGQLVGFAIVVAIEATPFIRRLIEGKLIPFLAKSKNALTPRRYRRASGGDPAGTALAISEVVMTSEEARLHYAQAIMAQHFANEKMRLLQSARIQDQKLDPRTLEKINQLTEAQAVDALERLIIERPDLLINLGESRPALEEPTVLKRLEN